MQEEQALNYMACDLKHGSGYLAVCWWLTTSGSSSSKCSINRQVPESNCTKH